MSHNQDLRAVSDDHALERVPDGDRHSRDRRRNVTYWRRLPARNSETTAIEDGVVDIPELNDSTSTIIKPEMPTVQSVPETEAIEVQEITELSEQEEEVVSDSEIPARIQLYLTEAESSISELRLTTPEQNNAFQYYKNVLALDPENTEAIAGMNRIVEYYAGLFARAIKDDNLYRAGIYLRRVERVMPDAPAVMLMRKRMAEAERLEPDRE